MTGRNDIGIGTVTYRPQPYQAAYGSVHGGSTETRRKRRGKDFEYRIQYPSGETRTLLSVPHYRFSWQLWYNLSEPLVLSKGTKIECTAHFDNSANNADNPDPTKDVVWGDQSWDEMMVGFFNLVFDARMPVKDLFPPTRNQIAAAGH